mgnify:CR=1 FL=1
MKKKSTTKDYDVDVEPKRKRGRKKKDEELLDDDLQYWGDSKAFANDYVSDVAYGTTRFDNDWG